MNVSKKDISAADPPLCSPEAVTGKRTPSLRRMLRWCAIVLGALLVLGWALIPALRAITLISNSGSRSAPVSPSNLAVQEVHFQATDGVHLVGWFILVSQDAPTILLVHGYKGSRMDTLPWARFLSAAGYNVLLYDSRGCGESEGWGITLGTREPDDVVGAVHYLQQRADLHTRRFGALGISLGAGVVLLAAAREHTLVATVADSAWADARLQVNRMGSLSLPHLTLPLLPYGPALTNALIGGDLANTRPLAVIGQIAPRAIMLIHSADDQNATTPLSGERQLFSAAGQPKEEWIAPNGGHIGALHAHPQEYEQRVLAFFAHYLKTAPLLHASLNAPAARGMQSVPSHLPTWGPDISNVRPPLANDIQLGRNAVTPYEARKQVVTQKNSTNIVVLSLQALRCYLR
jgi:pimeloyl-ACP methyl ester carboxylesterase